MSSSSLVILFSAIRPSRSVCQAFYRPRWPASWRNDTTVYKNDFTLSPWCAVWSVVVKGAPLRFSELSPPRLRTPTGWESTDPSHACCNWCLAYRNANTTRLPTLRNTCRQGGRTAIRTELICAITIAYSHRIEKFEDLKISLAYE